MALKAVRPGMNLGKKRTCEACGRRFYDLHRLEPSCPACGHAVAPAEATLSLETTTETEHPAETLTGRDESQVNAAFEDDAEAFVFAADEDDGGQESRHL